LPSLVVSWVDCVLYLAVCVWHVGGFNEWAVLLDRWTGTCLIFIAGAITTKAVAAGYAGYYKKIVCEKDQIISEKDQTIREKDETIRRCELRIAAFTPNKVLTVPDAVMIHTLLPCLRLKDYFSIGCADRHLQGLWEQVIDVSILCLCVPEDCKTLKEAVGRVHGDDRLTTIVVGKGEHQIDGLYLRILSAMNIVGDPGVPKSEIVVVSGIHFKEGIQGNCHLQHLTLRQAKKQCGVFGHSSFTMDDVLVEQCGLSGVIASGAAVVGRCTSVEVRQCGWSGVVADNGASVTLIGAKTTVHHNCAKGNRGEYGLKVYGSFSSTIHLLSPLTKEQVAIKNGGGGNWGAERGADIHRIKTIAQ
jgi:hypothetical protein